MSESADGIEPPRAPGSAAPPGQPDYAQSSAPQWQSGDGQPSPPAWPPIQVPASQPGYAQPSALPWQSGDGQPSPPAWPPSQVPASQPGYGPPGYGPPVQLGPAPGAYPDPAVAPGPFLRPAAGTTWFEVADLRFAGPLVAVLAVVGAATGLLWSAISPHSRGIVVPGLGVIPDESESFVAADGRYALLTGAVGLVIGIVVWSVPRRRGPVTAAALGAGGLIASVLTAVVGHAVSSGHSTGSANTVITLPVTLHAHGLLLLGPAVALLAYLVGVLLARPDDLGRPAGGAAGAPGTTRADGVADAYRTSDPVSVTGADGVGAGRPGVGTAGPTPHDGGPNR